MNNPFGIMDLENKRQAIDLWGEMTGSNKHWQTGAQ